MDKTKERMSGFELLRIIAMILVLIVHVLICLPRPTTTTIIEEPFKAIGFYITNSISIVCVNIFVLISGWFGIEFKMRKFAILLFQVFFFALFVWGTLAFIFPENYINWHSASTILMLNSHDYWFIKSYLGLLLRSPIINIFIRKTSSIQYRNALISFYIFQTIYGWLSIDGAVWISGGYSAFSFICLYLLGRYIRLYESKIYIYKHYTIEVLSVSFLVYSFIVIVLILTLIAFSVTYIGLPVEGRLFTYTNPLVILESVVLILIFRRISLKSSIINWIASSCLAIYLLHGNELILRPYYGRWIAQWYHNNSTIGFLLNTSLFLVLVSIVAILLDQVRLALSRMIFSRAKNV